MLSEEDVFGTANGSAVSGSTNGYTLGSKISVMKVGGTWIIEGDSTSSMHAWWLRSPSGVSQKVAYVSADGTYRFGPIGDGSIVTDSSQGGYIRPAMWISFSKLFGK